MNQELEDLFYEQVAREIAEKNYQPASMARAVEKSAGNPDLAKSLYVKFRVEQLARDFKQETRRRQLEAEELAVAERRQAADRAKTIAEEKIRQKKSEQLRQQRVAEEARAAAEERRKEAIKRKECEDQLREQEEMERARKAREIDEISRQAVFKQKQKEAAERAVARQKARNDLLARVRLYLVQAGVISGVDVPLPEELKRSTSSWDVHFGGLVSDVSRTGYVKRGRLRIENGTIVIDGWKLFNKALRVVIGIVLACALTWAFHRLDDSDKIDLRMGASMQRLFAVSFLENLQQIVGQKLPFPAMWNIKGSLYIGISICIAVYVSSYHLALHGSGTFVPVTRPKCRGRSLTMKIRPLECQKARRVCLRFRSHLDARVFQSHFEQ
jgi:hypothetical protein